MAKIRTGFVSGTITDNPLTNVATTMNSAELADLAAVSSPDTATIILDPQGTAGDPEIVTVTAHTGAATSATITRGAESTSARQHASGVAWVHGPTVQDWSDLGMKKTSGGGYFLVPAGPATGTTVASSASGDTYGSWVEMDASASADYVIIGTWVRGGSVAPDYIQLDIGVGAAASESSVSEVKHDSESQRSDFVALWAPIAISSGDRVACRTADNEASSLSHTVTLVAILESDIASL